MLPIVGSHSGSIWCPADSQKIGPIYPIYPCYVSDTPPKANSWNLFDCLAQMIFSFPTFSKGLAISFFGSVAPRIKREQKNCTNPTWKCSNPGNFKNKSKKPPGHSKNSGTKTAPWICSLFRPRPAGRLLASRPAGRQSSQPAGRPLPCGPAGRPAPCSPAGRPNWLAGWLIVLVCSA